MNYKELVERKNDLVVRAESIVKEAETNKRELTEAEAAELAEIRDNVKDIKAKLEALDMVASEKKETKEEVKEEEVNEAACSEENDRRAFEAYIRGVVLNERGTDYNLPKDGNGAVIPTTIANKIISKVYDICPILEKSTKYNVKGKLVIPYYDESSHAITCGYVDEFEELNSSVGSFDKVELNGFLAGCLVKISKSLINNADFNIVDYVVEKMAYAIKRFIEGECLHGSYQKVEGLAGGVTLGVTASAQTAVTADEIIRLHDSIKDDFQSGAIWIMSPKTRTALRTLKSSTGYYLLNDDISSPFGSTLLGKPIYVSDAMEDMAAGKIAIYYGDMKGLATKLTNGMSIEVLRERFATQYAVGVVGHIEFDAAVEDAQSIAKLTMASA